MLRENVIYWIQRRQQAQRMCLLLWYALEKQKALDI